MNLRSRRGVTLIEMMLVVLLVSLMAALTFPGVSSGLDSIRMRTAADAVAGLLAQAMVQVERRQEPVEFSVVRDEGLIEVRSLRPGFHRDYKLPDGITIDRVLPEPPGEPPAVRSLLVFPGATFPRVTLVLVSTRGHVREIRVDPVTGVARVEQPEQTEPAE